MKLIVNKNGQNVSIKEDSDIDDLEQIMLPHNEEDLKSMTLTWDKGMKIKDALEYDNRGKNSEVIIELY